MAAGLGFKTFTTGEVLTAADTNGYLMQGVLVFASSAARSAAITSPQEGQVSYLKDTDATQYYTGSTWTALGAAAPSFSLINAGGTALSGSSAVTISGISGMSTLWVNVTGGVSTTASDGIYLRLNAVSTGSLYDNSGSRGLAPATYATTVQGQSTSGTSGGDQFQLADTSSNAASIFSGGMMLFGCNSTGTKVGYYFSGAGANGGSGQASRVQIASFRSSNTISSITISTSSTTNFTAGTIYVYGSA
jgi:hypothetical protein